MFEYKYVKIDMTRAGFMEIKPKEDYHKLIDEHSRQGWRLVQVFAPPTWSDGLASYFELIFEKEVK